MAEEYKRWKRVRNSGLTANYNVINTKKIKKIYINVYDWGVANKIYGSKKEADKDAKGRNRLLRIEEFISKSDYNKYKRLKCGKE